MSWFRWARQARISQKISCYGQGYLESENMYSLINMCCFALQHWYLDLSPRGFVFPGSLNTLDWRPRPKSLRSAGLTSRFPMRPSAMLQEELCAAARLGILWHDARRENKWIKYVTYWFSCKYLYVHTIFDVLLPFPIMKDILSYKKRH